MEIGKSQNTHLRQTLLGNAIYFQAQGGHWVQWGLYYDIDGFVKKLIRLWLNQDGEKELAQRRGYLMEHGMWTFCRCCRGSGLVLWNREVAQLSILIY